MKATAINDVILAVVSSLSALSYPVYDGPPDTRPARGVEKYVCIGAQSIEDVLVPTEAATMDAELHGLGNVARYEALHINCVAVGKRGTVTEARAKAEAVMQDVSTNLELRPSDESYGAHISSVNSVLVQNKTGGAVVQIQFTISANARLT